MLPAAPPARPHRKPIVMHARARLHLHPPQPPPSIQNQVIPLVIPKRFRHFKSAVLRLNHELHLRHIPAMLGSVPSSGRGAFLTRLRASPDALHMVIPENVPSRPCQTLSNLRHIPSRPSSRCSTHRPNPIPGKKMAQAQRPAPRLLLPYISIANRRGHSGHFPNNILLFESAA
jgi:hypothetical protein